MGIEAQFKPKGKLIEFNVQKYIKQIFSHSFFLNLGTLSLVC